MTKVALLSDIHMRDGYTEAISDELEAVIEYFEVEHDPAHAFVLGDLIEDCGSAQSDAENVSRVKTILDSWSVPVTYLLGNHDVELLTKTELSELLEQPSFHGVETVDGTPFVYLDSACVETKGAKGKLGLDQQAWLTETLRSVEDAIVLVHHPIGNFDITDNEWFSAYPERAYLWDRKEALKQFEEIGTVQTTISGHIHQTSFNTVFDIPHVSINAFSKELPDVPLTGTYGVVELGSVPTVDVATRETHIATYRCECASAETQ